MAQSTVTLSTPIKRGETEISEIMLREPKGGDLRGLSIQALMQAEYNAVATLVPRIAIPQVLDTDFADMGAADIAAFAGEIVGFFMTSAQKALVFESMGMVTSESSTG